MLPLVPAIVGVVVTLLLAIGAVLGHALTPWAGAVAAVFGSAIVVFAGFPYLALLILFVVASTLATRYRFEEKQKSQLQEGRAGERGVSNVIAHILIPTGLAVAGGGTSSLLPAPTLAVLYTSALAFGASDTFASEFGVLAGKARAILTFRPVPPGTNGGISGLGEVAAFGGAVTTAAVGLALFAGFGPVPTMVVGFFVAVVASGFLGCQVDSVLGETLENRGWLTKGTTNFLGMLSSVLIAAALFRAAGGPW